MINATSAGGYMGSRPPLFSLDRLKALVGGYGDKVKDGARTIFAPEIVTEGWRDVFAGVKSGIGQVGGGLTGAASEAVTGLGATTSGSSAAIASATTASSSGISAVTLAPVGRDAAGRFIHLDVAKLGQVGRDASGRFVSLKGAASGGSSAGLTTVGEASQIVAEAPRTGLGAWFQKLFGGGKTATPPAGSLPTVPTAPTPVPGSSIGTPLSAGPELNISLKFNGPAQAREVTTLKIIREPIKINGMPAGGGAGSGASAVAGSADDVLGAAGGKVGTSGAVGTGGATGATGATGANGAGGGTPSAGSAGQAGSLIRSGLAKIWDGMKAGAKNGALFSAVISGVVNGFQVLTGQKRLSEGVGTVAADTASGAVSGATGAAVSGLALAAAGAFGLTAGLPLTLIGIGGGLLGAFIGDRFFKGTGIYDGIKGLFTKIFGG